MANRSSPSDASDASEREQPTRQVLKFDTGRRGFTRAIWTLAVFALGLLLFGVFFFWRWFGSSGG